MGRRRWWKWTLHWSSCAGPAFMGFKSLEASRNPQMDKSCPSELKAGASRGLLNKWQVVHIVHLLLYQSNSAGLQLRRLKPFAKCFTLIDQHHVDLRTLGLCLMSKQVDEHNEALNAFPASVLHLYSSVTVQSHPTVHNRDKNPVWDYVVPAMT